MFLDLRVFGEIFRIQVVWDHVLFWMDYGLIRTCRRFEIDTVTYLIVKIKFNYNSINEIKLNPMFFKIIHHFRFIKI